MNWIDGLILGVVILIFALLIFFKVRKKKSGESGCACCPYRKDCGGKTDCAERGDVVKLLTKGGKDTTSEKIDSVQDVGCDEPSQNKNESEE